MLATVWYNTCLKIPQIDCLWQRFTRTDATSKVTFFPVANDWMANQYHYIRQWKPLIIQNSVVSGAWNILLIYSLCNVQVQFFYLYDIKLFIWFVLWTFIECILGLDRLVCNAMHLLNLAWSIFWWQRCIFVCAKIHYLQIWIGCSLHISEW